MFIFAVPARRALALLLTLTLVGCGGSGVVAPYAPTTTQTSSQVSPVPNTVAGNVTVQETGKVSTPVYVALMQGRTTVSRTVLDGGGAFRFPSLPDGSYQLVLSGQGLRTQSDLFNVRNGAVITTAYTLSQVGSTPSQGEMNGMLAQALRMVRGLSGFRALPLAAQSAIDFNRRNNFVTTVPKTVKANKTVNDQAPPVLAIPVNGALKIAVDRTGTAWVSVNNALFGPPGSTATSAGVVQISTQAQVMGQFATAPAPDSGGGMVGVSDSLDVAVQNLKLMSTCYLPGGQTNITAFPPAGTDVSVSAFVNQPVPGATSRNRLVAVGQTDNTPTLGFLAGSAAFIRVTLPGTIPADFAPTGAWCDPSDQTIYMSGYQTTGLNGPAHLYHLSADGTTLLEDVNLGGFMLNSVQNLAHDTAGNLWMFTDKNLVRVGPAPGRVVTLIPATHQDTTPFSLVSAIATDGLGHVWAADQQSNNVTEFDLNGVPIMTLDTGAQPASMAVDPSNNVWIACQGATQDQGVVNEVVIGGVVPPNTQVQTRVSAGFSTVTVTPGPVQSTFLQTFPSSTYSQTVTYGPTVVTSGPTITSRTDAVLVAGPTVVSQTAQVQTGTYTVSGASTDARSGAPLQYQGNLASNGFGEFIAMTPESSVEARYSAGPSGGSILLEATTTQYCEVYGVDAIITYQIVATFAPDGSITDFRVTTNSSDVAVRGSMTVDGHFLAEIFDIRNPLTRYSTATTQTLRPIVNALIDMLAQSIPTATPTQSSIATLYQGLMKPPVSPYAPGGAPGYTMLIADYTLGNGGEIDVPIGTTSLPTGSTNVNDATPPSQTVGQPDGAVTVPANQGITTPYDYGGQAGLEIAGICIGGTGFEKGGPTRKPIRR